MKPSPNTFCPCGSKIKYKKCCQPFHNGKLPSTALLLMKSRYSAFSFGVCRYIIKTTHKENSDFREDSSLWEKEIASFSSNTNFLGLRILDFCEEEESATVTFEAKLSSFGEDISFVEKSQFYKVAGVWLYHSGEFLDSPKR